MRVRSLTLEAKQYNSNDVFVLIYYYKEDENGRRQSELSKKVSPATDMGETSVPIHHSSFNIRHWFKWIWRIAVILAAVPILQVRDSSICKIRR